MQSGNAMLQEFTSQLKNVAAPDWLDKVNARLVSISNKIYQITQWGEAFKILDKVDFKVLLPQPGCFDFDPPKVSSSSFLQTKENLEINSRSVNLLFS